MPRSDLRVHFRKIEELIDDINNTVPVGTYESIKFRSELAGLLVVAISATYENCVKEILCDYANSHHISFGQFALRNYSKINSRVRVKDLKQYCDTFEPDICLRFRNRLSHKKQQIMNRVGKNIETSYEQILSWRHDFAHAGIRRTTIEEAAATHRIGKIVLQVFDDSFNRI